MAISISIVAGQDQTTSSVNASGTEQHVITDDERTTFNIGDKELKDSIKADFGKSPNDAYLHSPTPWHDLYKTYNWQQVQTILEVQSAEIIGISSKPTIVKTQEFKNSSSVIGDFNVSISESVSDTTSSNWSNVKKITMGQKIKYGVKFLGTGGEGETSLEYEESWGTGGQESKTITVGSESGVTVKLEPGQAIIAELSASRGTMKVRIKYRIHLIGYTATNYNPTYQKHHFWALPITRVMASGGKNNSLETIEDIEIGYYSNSKIEIKDKESGKSIQSHTMANIPAI
jgi:hypothetical protein